MLAVAAATSTYYGLLLTLALYLQQGLGRTALVSGLTLVSWVVAFGAAGQIVRRLPARFGLLAAPTGCLVLAGAYTALSASLFAGRHAEALLSAAAAGGLGLGTQFSALIVHLTNAVSDGYAHDISGVTTTTTTIAGAIAIAAFGTAYLSLASSGSPTHAFAVVTAGFAAIAALRPRWPTGPPAARRSGDEQAAATAARPAAQREGHANALERDRQGHLRLARDALAEDEGDLLDPLSHEVGELGRLDLEGVARGEHGVEVELGEHARAPQLEAAAEVVEGQAEHELRAGAAHAAQDAAVPSTSRGAAAGHVAIAEHEIGLARVEHRQHLGELLGRVERSESIWPMTR